MRRHIAVLLLLAACGAPHVLQEDGVAAALREAPAGAIVGLALDGGGIARVTVPATGSAPDLVERAAEAVQPGGELLLHAREWGPRGTGWRFVKRYSGSGRRSVLVDAQGRVRERSHSLHGDETPAHVLAAALAAAPGELVSVEVVQGAPGEEWFRVELRGTAGSALAEVERDGSLRRVARVRTAVLRIPD